MYHPNFFFYSFGLFLILSISACQSTPETNSEGVNSNNKSSLYAGEFIYAADAASFKNCQTDQQYPVTGGEAYLNLERAYMDADHTSFQPEWVQLEGHLEEQVGNSGKKETFLVVDNFIGLEEGRLCE